MAKAFYGGGGWGTWDVLRSTLTLQPFVCVVVGRPGTPRGLAEGLGTLAT